MAMQTAELVAGRELDALVAKKVMGLRFDPGTANMSWSYPPYSTDIAAAWQVVEHFERLGLVEIGKYYGWRVRFDDAEGDADTAPLAICRTALVAVEAQIVRSSREVNQS